ncbi:MAG: Trehalose/maltose import ATP-binding protein MalK [Candidatus Methanolliviera sp. GoM_oil]|nr:MAG: Trehalose/maltose import ATP-binding protein MalK [Candidatus Methanolliviera sp. GoM_oil]
MEDVIEVDGLTKKFGDLIAVDHISFMVKKGEIFGFLGPNGAGKSTCIKMLTTLLHPTSGSAKICGYDVVKERDQVRSCIGVVFQDRSSDRFLTGRQNLDFHARMYSMSKEERKEKISEVMDLLELNGKEDIRLNDVSEGIRRRFEVARGFMADPKVVFLDEPTIGFDIKARMDLWNQIKRAKEKEDTTVMLTTHYIEEADYLCDRVVIIDQAKIIAIDTPDKLKETVGTDLISLQIDCEPKVRKLEDRRFSNANRNNGDFIETIKKLDWVKSAEEYSNSILLNVESGDGRVPELIDFADENGFIISSIDEHKPSLEDVFLHFTGRAIRDVEGGVKGMKKKREVR